MDFLVKSKDNDILGYTPSEEDVYMLKLNYPGLVFEVTNEPKGPLISQQLAYNNPKLGRFLKQMSDLQYTERHRK